MLTLNGKPAAAGLTVTEQLRLMGLDPRMTAVERNGQIVPRAEYDRTRLRPGDRVEVVCFVGGG